MQIDPNLKGYINLGVAIWWTAQFRLWRKFAMNDDAPEYRSESTRRRFMSAFRKEAARARLAVPGVTS